jgi:hypothetical protein
MKEFCEQEILLVSHYVFGIVKKKPMKLFGLFTISCFRSKQNEVPVEKQSSVTLMYFDPEDLKTLQKIGYELSKRKPILNQHGFTIGYEDPPKKQRKRIFQYRQYKRTIIPFS